MSTIARIVWHGVGQGEEFTVSTTHQLDRALTATDCNNIVTGLTTELTGTAKTNLLQAISTLQSYDQVSIYYYDSTPNDPATFVAHKALTAWTGTGTAATPLQICMCVSTHSDYAGASNRGRMYMPCTGYGLGTHQYTQSQCDNVLIAAKGLLEQGALSIKLHSAVTAAAAVVFSSKNGATRAITSLSADTKPDTQRRRAMNVVPIALRTQTVVTS